MATKKLNLDPKIFLIDSSGKPKGVVLDIEVYEKFMQMAEDVADKSWIHSLSKEDRKPSRWEDAIRELKADGLL